MIRPLTQQLYDSIMLDTWPGFAACVDFGIDVQNKYEALYYPIRAGEITIEQLEEALGNGPKLTELVNSAHSNPHKGIVFVTAYDGLTEEE